MTPIRRRNAVPFHAVNATLANELDVVLSPAVRGWYCYMPQLSVDTHPARRFKLGVKEVKTNPTQ